jgi:hypothetical protein
MPAHPPVRQDPFVGFLYRKVGRKALTIVFLAVLIGIWGVFLGVTLVRKRADYRADSSIGAFQRQLQVLRRNSQAVDRLQGLDSGVLGDQSSAALAPFRSQRLNGRATYNEHRRQDPHALDGTVVRGSRQDPYFRRGACERRRDVLLILLSALVSTGLISIIPAARMALVLTAISGFALLVYVVMLVRLRAQAYEREMKLRYMPRPAAPPVFVDRRVVAR